MSLSDLGNLGEAISAIAVLATLIYLAYQTRQNTKMLRQSVDAQTAQMLSQNTDQGIQLLRDFMNNRELARVVDDLRNGKELEGADVLCAEAFLDAWFLRIENLLTQAHFSGFNQQDVESILATQVEIFRKSPAFIRWWSSRDSGYFSTGFGRRVSRLISGNDT